MAQSPHVHDCIVVGAGPAGASAALQLARAGLDVVLLERGSRPGEKNVMSGVLLTKKLAALIPDFRDRAPLQRLVTGGYHIHILQGDDVLHLPGLRSFSPERNTNPRFTVFRSQFDAWFAQEAVDAGAEFFPATLVEALLWEGGRVAGVRTRRGDLRARVVIGADGVNSTVAEKSGLLGPPEPAYVSLIIREILNLPPDVIEERFTLQPGHGCLNLFVGTVVGKNGHRSVYYSELYTNRDSLSLTSEVPLHELSRCGVPANEVLAGRERHPYIARLIKGATLREYQAHLIPRGGIGDLEKLYGAGVLLVGDAGRFVTTHGVGSWPAMASGAAAAGTVRLACEAGDFSRRTLSAYLDLLDGEGLVDTQHEARANWAGRLQGTYVLERFPDEIFRVARRYLEDWGDVETASPYSVWGDLYHHVIKPLAPWYLRWPLGLAAWVDTWRWRRGHPAGHMEQDSPPREES